MRLKALRLARNDTMAVFAERLGVSAGTLRAMEHGTATVNIGVWIRALWVLAQKASLLEQARAPRHRGRQRASRRPNRSRAIQIALHEKIERMEGSRLAAECAKLDPKYEQSLADEGLGADVAAWPEF